MLFGPLRPIAADNIRLIPTQFASLMPFGRVWFSTLYASSQVLLAREVRHRIPHPLGYSGPFVWCYVYANGGRTSPFVLSV